MKHERTIRITPLDPLMIRDGRPFGISPGIRARSLRIVTSSVVAGTLRTLLRKSLGGTVIENDTNKISSKQVAKVDVRGPLYVKGNNVFFPMPQDVGFYEGQAVVESSTTRQSEGKIMASIRRPMYREERNQVDSGFLGTGVTGLHEDKLWPVAMPDSIMKPLQATPACISSSLMIEWLCDKLDNRTWSRYIGQWKSDQAEEEEPKDNSNNIDDYFLTAFPKEVRTHTAIDEETNTAKNQHLFSTESIVLPTDVSLIAKINTSNIEQLENVQRPIDRLHSFGGKRRLAHFTELGITGDTESIWTCPDKILETIQKHPKFLRMILTTPAFFSKGWIPGWLDEHLRSTDKLYERIRMSNPVKLQLRWACVPRWEAISGWSYGEAKPKAVRRMVSAGSVYFFEVLDGDPVEFVEKFWLQSLSDRDRRKAFFDREDGYGIATWGIWKPQ